MYSATMPTRPVAKITGFEDQVLSESLVRCCRHPHGVGPRPDEAGRGGFDRAVYPMTALRGSTRSASTRRGTWSPQ